MSDKVKTLGCKIMETVMEADEFRVGTTGCDPELAINALISPTVYLFAQYPADLRWPFFEEWVNAVAKRVVEGTGLEAADDIGLAAKFTMWKH